MRTLQEQIAANKRASFFYAFFLVVLLTVMGAVLAGVYDPDSWAIGAGAAFVAGIIVAMIARFAGTSIVLSMSGAREPTGLEGRILENVAEEMAIAAGIPKPRVLVIDDSAPNAFATGPDPERAVVVFTTGILQKLDRDELQGVMAHEMAHVRNYDIRFMTTIAMIAGLIPLLADWLGRSLWHGAGRRRDNENNQAQIIFFVLAILLAILAPIFAKLLELAVSRQREFLADSTAAELTRYPEGLARALEKIALDREPLEVANRATQHMYIINPMKAWESRAQSLFSTHPPTEERIRRLRGMMGASQATQQLATGNFEV
jgi:heat shock protein HtpX